MVGRTPSPAPPLTPRAASASVPGARCGGGVAAARGPSEPGTVRARRSRAANGPPSDRPGQWVRRHAPDSGRRYRPPPREASRPACMAVCRAGRYRLSRKAAPAAVFFGWHRDALAPCGARASFRCPRVPPRSEAARRAATRSPAAGRAPRPDVCPAPDGAGGTAPSAFAAPAVGDAATGGCTHGPASGRRSLRTSRTHGPAARRRCGVARGPQAPVCRGRLASAKRRPGAGRQEPAGLCRASRRLASAKRRARPAHAAGRRPRAARPASRPGTPLHRRG